MDMERAIRWEGIMGPSSSMIISTWKEGSLIFIHKNVPKNINF